MHAITTFREAARLDTGLAVSADLCDQARADLGRLPLGITRTATTHHCVAGVSLTASKAAQRRDENIIDAMARGLIRPIELAQMEAAHG